MPFTGVKTQNKRAKMIAFRSQKEEKRENVSDFNPFQPFTQEFSESLTNQEVTVNVHCKGEN